MLEFLFNKAAGLKVCNSIKKRLQYRFFPENVQISKNAYFYRRVSVAVSEV